MTSSSMPSSLDLLREARTAKHLRLLHVLPLTLHMRRHSNAEQLNSLVKQINSDSSGRYAFDHAALNILKPIYNLLSDWEDKIRSEIDHGRPLVYMISAFTDDSDTNTKPVKQLRYLALIMSVFDKLLHALALPNATDDSDGPQHDVTLPTRKGISPSILDEHQEELRDAGVLRWQESVMGLCNAWTDARSSFIVPSQTIGSDAELVMSLNKEAGRGQGSKKVGTFQTSMCYVAMGIKALSMVSTYTHATIALLTQP